MPMQHSQSNILPLSVDNLSVSYAGHVALQDVSFSAQAGRLIAVIGPNGAGKSTFLKAVCGLIPQSYIDKTASVQFWGGALDKGRARVAYMAQRQNIDWSFPICVYDVVAMGASAQLGVFKRLSADHKACIESALQAVKMQDFAKAQIGKLSGGQQQRVFMARALVQNADLYMMDEPLAGVDFQAQDILLSVLSDLKSQGKTVCVVHHDLAGVQAYFDDALLLNKAAIACGTVNDVLAPENIQAAYGRLATLSRRA
jgi:manganese/zinc/iron transport system ATP- binding protein